MSSTGILWATTATVRQQGNGTWSNLGKAAGPADGVNAVYAAPAAFDITALQLAGYGAATAIGTQPSSLDGITVTVYSHETSTNTWGAVLLDLFAGPTWLSQDAPLLTISGNAGNSQTVTLGAADVPPWADLDGLEVVVQATHRDRRAASEFLVDAVSVEVAYTP